LSQARNAELRLVSGENERREQQIRRLGQPISYSMRADEAEGMVELPHLASWAGAKEWRPDWIRVHVRAEKIAAVRDIDRVRIHELAPPKRSLGRGQDYADQAPARIRIVIAAASYARRLSKNVLGVSARKERLPWQRAFVHLCQGREIGEGLSLPFGAYPVFVADSSNDVCALMKYKVVECSQVAVTCGDHDEPVIGIRSPSIETAIGDHQSQIDIGGRNLQLRDGAVEGAQRRWSEELLIKER
jgi:hypothetical protein